MKKILTMSALAAVLAAPVEAAGDAAFFRDLSEVRVQAVETARAQAEARAASPVISDKTTEVRVPLNASTVKCSAADYSQPMLKVLIPALAGLTVLNHRNFGEGAPCVAAGACRGAGTGPEAILSSGEGVDTVPVRVELKKEMRPEGEMCRVTLIEKVTTVIRGVEFFHERRHGLPDRMAEDCL